MKSKTSSTIPAEHDDVAVVILNWNGLRFLQQFLPAVVKHTPEHVAIWIADNGSTDGSIDWVRKTFKRIHIHENRHNFGFARGYNVALQHIHADTYVLLNSDVEVSENWIQPVINYMASGRLVACQPKIIDYHQRDTFEHAGATGGFIDRNGYVFCAGRIFNSFERDHGQYNANKEVFWASGACLFIKAAVYHELEGFDEDFYAHMEEIDLCWRLKNRGHAIGACGESHVYHVGGGTLHKLNPFKTFLNFRNNLFILVKNYHRSPIFLLLVKRMVLDGVAAFRFLTEGKWSYFIAVIKAHVSFYAKSITMFKKRRRLLKANRDLQQTPNETGWYTGSIVRDYFIANKHHFTDLDQEQFLTCPRSQTPTTSPRL
jgi:GT2 family glycosyltransferase